MLIQYSKSIKSITTVLVLFLIFNPFIYAEDSELMVYTTEPGSFRAEVVKKLHRAIESNLKIKTKCSNVYSNLESDKKFIIPGDNYDHSLGTSSSLQDCVESCFEHEGCLLVQYHDENAQCLLLNKLFLDACGSNAQVKQGEGGFYQIKMPNSVLELRKQLEPVKE